MDRLKRLCEALEEGQGMLITSAENRFYLTGLRSSAGTLAVTREESVLFIDFRYFEMARRVEQAHGFRTVLLKKEDRQLREFFSSHGVHTLYAEPGSLSVSRFETYRAALPELHLTRDSRMEHAVLKLRECKDETEQSLIAQAQRITDAAFSSILGFIRPGVTEKQIAAELEYRMKQEGADGFAFDTIALSGPNTALPHGQPSDRPVQPGEFVLMDFGASVGGYQSDMTRTVAVGSADPLMKEVYATVLRAQRAALAMLRPGVQCCMADKTARDMIEAGFPDTFGHSLGHSLGVEIHEGPTLSPTCERTLKPGMIVTVEPGIYLTGRFGVRIEDFVQITVDGIRNFTRSEKELLVL